MGKSKKKHKSRSKKKSKHKKRSKHASSDSDSSSDEYEEVTADHLTTNRLNVSREQCTKEDEHHASSVGKGDYFERIPHVTHSLDESKFTEHERHSNNKRNTSRSRSRTPTKSCHKSHKSDKRRSHPHTRSRSRSPHQRHHSTHRSHSSSQKHDAHSNRDRGSSDSKKDEHSRVGPDYEFRWDDHRFMLDKIFFQDEDVIRRGTPRYDDFWGFLKKYTIHQKKKAEFGHSE